MAVRTDEQDALPLLDSSRGGSWEAGRWRRVAGACLLLALLALSCALAVAGVPATQLIDNFFGGGAAARHELSADDAVLEPHPWAEVSLSLAGNASSRRAPPLRGLRGCPECYPDCPELAQALAGYRVRPASEAPESFELSGRYSGFYAKYINVMGVPVLSSDKVCDCTLRKAAWTIHGVLSHLVRFEEVVPEMVAQGSRVAVMADSEVTTDVPEHADLSPKDYWDTRARGLGATPSRPCSTGAEESISCESYSSNRYHGENILVHEFVHGIARTGFQFLDWDGSAWDTFNEAVYEKSKGLWQDTYAGSNKIELFAEASQNWFGVNLQAHCCASQVACNDGIHNCVDTREEMQSFDPDLYAHLSSIWKADGWSPGTADNGCGCQNADPIEGFVPLDEDGNIAGGTSSPPAGGEGGSGDNEEIVVPPDEQCESIVHKEECSSELGCEWGGDRCQVSCGYFTVLSACEATGVCSWRGGSCHACLDHEDSHQWCEDWAEAGECATNAGFMQEKCKLWCLRLHEHMHCADWAEAGECGNNPGFMFSSCQHSCSCKQLNR